MKTKLAALVVLGGIALGAVATTVFAAPPPEKVSARPALRQEVGTLRGQEELAVKSQEATRQLIGWTTS